MRKRLAEDFFFGVRPTLIIGFRLVNKHIQFGDVRTVNKSPTSTSDTGDLDAAACSLPGLQIANLAVLEVKLQ